MERVNIGVLALHLLDKTYTYKGVIVNKQLYNNFITFYNLTLVFTMNVFPSIFNLLDTTYFNQTLI